jgi:hypothetical protein
MTSKKTSRAQTLSRWSFWLSVFVTLAAVFAPSNLFYGFDQFSWAVRGLRIDYLLPKIYLIDLILLGVFLAGFRAVSFKNFAKSWIEKMLIVLAGALLARQFFTDFPTAAVMQFLRLSLFGVTAFVVSKNWSHIRLHWVWLGLALSNFLEGLLSLWQFFTQQSLGSYHTLFGEPSLTQSFGLAQGTFGSWGEKILPYGTTAHPNILAAWLATSWLLLLFWSGKIPLAKPLKILILIVTGAMALWGVFATQSVAALGLLLHGIGYLMVKWILPKFSSNLQFLKIGFAGLVFSIVLSPWIAQSAISLLPKNFSDQPSVTRRVYLLTASQSMLLHNPIWGVGLNQFTANLEATSQFREPVRFDQPVHHILWLWITETGLLGLGLLTLTLWQILRNNLQKLSTLVVLIWLLFPSLVWDHYLFTQPTGLLILWFWWVSLCAED